MVLEQIRLKCIRPTSEAIGNFNKWNHHDLVMEWKFRWWKEREKKSWLLCITGWALWGLGWWKNVCLCVCVCSGVGWSKIWNCLKGLWYLWDVQVASIRRVTSVNGLWFSMPSTIFFYESSSILKILKLNSKILF